MNQYDDEFFDSVRDFEDEKVNKKEKIPQSQSQEQFQDAGVWIISEKNKKIGFFLLISPIISPIVLVIVMSIYEVVEFINSSMGATPESPLIGVSIAKLILSVLGAAAALLFFLSIPLAIIFLRKKEFVADVKYDNRSGNKAASIIPNEIKGWNWGAAGLLWIWGIWNGVWISLLSLIPFFGFIMIIILGIKGSEWAWRAKKWQSVDSFLSEQKKWKPWGILFFILMILMWIFNLLGIFLDLSNQI